MKSNTAIGVLALVAGAVAHEHAHEKFHQLRAAQESACLAATTTVTSYGSWGLVPATSTSTSSKSSSSTSSSTSTSCTSTSTSSSAAPVTTSSSAPAPPVYSAPSSSSSSSSSAAAAYEYKAAVSTDSPSAPAAPAAPVSSPSAPASSAPQNSNSKCAAIAPNGNKWAFCYTAYTSGGDCKSADQVASDVASLKAKGFTSIRTYANDCNTISNVGSAARANGMSMLVGVNIDGSGIGSYTDGQVSTLLSWGASNWDIVEMIIVGNEAIFNGWASPSGLAGLIADVKGKVSAAGYCGPVTTTEPLNIIEANGPTICGAVDVIGANIHPFFNGAVDAYAAGGFVASQLSDLAGVCGNSKPAYILETGWPSAGSANGAAVPGFDTQKAAIDGIMASSGSKAAVFSYLNDQWKAPGPFGVEQNWGCAGLF